MALQFRRGLEADLPSPTDAAIGEPLFTTDSGKLFIKKANGSFGQISGSSVWGSITGTLSAQTDLNAALAAKVNEADLPQDGSGNLDIAQESTLQAFSTQVSALESSVSALGYLSTYFTDAALPATPGATGGYLKWDPASGGSWAIDANQITAPAEINGGNASSFSE